jgi:hypothetical protein
LMFMHVAVREREMFMHVAVRERGDIVNIIYLSHN